MIFETINSLGLEITSTKPYFFERNNKYRRPPYFRFKFVNCPKHNEISTYLTRRVDEFSGNLKWIIITTDLSDNYILIPKIFEKYFGNLREFTKDEIVKAFKGDYIKSIDDAIADIPKLSEFIRIGI